MSYTIYYNVMSVKLSKGNKYIPMVLSGDNNVRRYDGSRARSWNNISDRKGKVFFTPDELMEETKHIIDTNEYLSDNRISGNGNMTPRKLINLSKKCIQNAISFTQAVNLSISVYWYDKRYDFTPQKFVPKTEDELIDFVNADENKGKTLFIGFQKESDATDLCEMMNTFRKAFQKKSNGEKCLHCYLWSNGSRYSEKIHKYVGKGKDGEPVLVDSYDKAFKFEDITNTLMRSSFYYLKYYKGESDIFSVSQIEV